VAVGHYSVALALFEIVLILPVAAGGVLTSHVARQELASGGAGWRPTLTMAGGMALVCGLAALAAPALIPLLFGTAFAPAAGPFGWLLLAAWFGTLHQSWQPTLQVRGRARDLMLPPLVAGGIACLLAWLLVPILGTSGALASAIAGYAVLAGITGWLAHRATDAAG
jgi:O-antigen/teichoic acid export membrane protein